MNPVARGLTGWQHAELVAVGVDHHDPVHVTLADVDLPCAEGEQALDLRQLVAVRPGREVEVIQQAPVTVVRVEHIDLAFESRIAVGILVRPTAKGA